MFARLSGSITDDARLLASKYGANFRAVNEKGHWIEVIASIFKKGNTMDALAAKTLMKTLNNGFDGDALKPTRASS